MGEYERNRNMKSKVGRIILINKNIINIRIWKTWYITIWLHKPVGHLPCIYICKLQFCGKPFYLDDPDDKKILGLAKDELDMVGDISDLIDDSQSF